MSAAGERRFQKPALACHSAADQSLTSQLNAVGGHAIYAEVVPVTMFKVVGVDITSMERIETRSDTEIEIAQANVETNGYRKLIIAECE